MSSTSTIASTQQSEVEETIKRIQTHKGVQGFILTSNDGSFVRSTIDNSTTMSLTGLIRTLADKAKSCVRDLDPQNDLTVLRIRTKKQEILVAPDLFTSYLNGTGSQIVTSDYDVHKIFLYTFKVEVDDALKRVQEHKGVQGYLIINNDGIPIRSTLDASLTQQYAALIKSLSDKGRSTIREIDPTNELVFFRLRTKKHEILVAPEKEYIMIVLQATDVQ